MRLPTAPWTRWRAEVETARRELQEATAARIAAEERSRTEISQAKEAVTELTRAVQEMPATRPRNNARGIYDPFEATVPTHGVYAFDRPIVFSTPQPPIRRPYSPVTVETLRMLADTYDILRGCIVHLQREVHAVPINIVPQNDSDKSERTKKRVAKAEAFFKTPGGLGGIGGRRSHFENQCIEDLCVIGAAAVYYHPTRGNGLYEVYAIDAATIRPRVDGYGWPGPGQDAFEQWVYGRRVTGLTREQLTFDGLYMTSYSPYPKGPIEWLLNAITGALFADSWNRLWLTEGNTPSDFVALPDAWTPDQIEQFVEWFDALLAGNISRRVKTRFLPAGSSRLANPTRKDQEFQLYEEWMMRRVCSVMGVQPASIGYPQGQYATTQSQSATQTTEFGVGPILEWRKALYDNILVRMGFEELECRNVVGAEEEAGDRAERNVRLVGGGIKTVNEARADEGLDSMEDGDTLLIPGTLKTLDQILNPVLPVPTGGGGFGSNSAPPTNPDESEERPNRASQAEPKALAQWERKAINRLKDGRSAAAPFVTDDLPPLLMAWLSERLEVCADASSVRALFRQAETLLVTMNPEVADRKSFGERWRERRLLREREYADTGSR